MIRYHRVQRCAFSENDYVVYAKFFILHVVDRDHVFAVSCLVSLDLFRHVLKLVIEVCPLTICHNLIGARPSKVIVLRFGIHVNRIALAREADVINFLDDIAPRVDVRGVVLRELYSFVDQGVLHPLACIHWKQDYLYFIQPNGTARLCLKIIRIGHLANILEQRKNFTADFFCIGVELLLRKQKILIVRFCYPIMCCRIYINLKISIYQTLCSDLKNHFSPLTHRKMFLENILRAQA